jgi:uridine kinase
LDKSESVLALLMSENEYWKIFHDSARFIDFAKQIIAENIDKTIKDIIVLAHDFAIIIEGAHIAYNQEIQRHFFGHDYFADTWNDWYQSFRTEMIAYEHFDPGHLFQYATTTKPYTIKFVNKWWQLLCEDNIIEEEKSKIIREQEYYAKRNKARIKYSNKYNVKENTRLGLGMLQYRFFNVKTIVNDVVQSL